jgi:ATP-dependent protease ClpP protease subunit
MTAIQYRVGFLKSHTFFSKVTVFRVFAYVKDLDSLPKLYIRGQIAPKDSFMTMMGGEFFSATDVVDFLNNNKDISEFVVEISSDGGYRGEGVEIYNQLKNCGKTVHTVTYKANSIATIIMLSGNGQRLIVEHSQFIVHFARIDPINLGMDPLTADDFQKLADETDRADRQILDIYCSELGEEKRAELSAAMADEKDLGAKGAIKLGFVLYSLIGSSGEPSWRWSVRCRSSNPMPWPRTSSEQFIPASSKTG